jgi:hypothetical protein
VVAAVVIPQQHQGYQVDLVAAVVMVVQPALELLVKVIMVAQDDLQMVVVVVEALVLLVQQPIHQ